jgi:Cu(I)/Ag(I) efflux system membrane fusion protein
MKQLAESSLQRLKNWDISEEQVKALASSGEAKRTLTFRSPVAGVVTEKKAVQGMRFMPGETLFQIADTSAVWVQADVFEQDIARSTSARRQKSGSTPTPAKLFEGRIAYVYPTLKAETRTVPVRIELANPKGQAEAGDVCRRRHSGGGIRNAGGDGAGLGGHRQRRARSSSCSWAKGASSRAVKLGQRGSDFVQVLEGVKDGDGGGRRQLPDRCRKQPEGGAWRHAEGGEEAPPSRLQSATGRWAR